jgi:hypothetical protein
MVHPDCGAVLHLANIPDTGVLVGFPFLQKRHFARSPRFPSRLGVDGLLDTNPDFGGSQSANFPARRDGLVAQYIRFRVLSDMYARGAWIRTMKGAIHTKAKYAGQPHRKLDDQKCFHF